MVTATVTPLRLREARWQDLAVLADHERELFGAEAWSLASWWGELAGRPRREYVVAEDADGIAGYGGLDHAGDTSDVMTIATLPRARGTGLGRRLLAELVDRARAAGAERLVLEVRADNVAARGLYDSAGFGLLQTRRGYYPGGVDALVLALDLTQEPLRQHEEYWTRLADYGPCQALADLMTLKETFGTLDGLVHCAGVADLGRIEHTDAEQWRRAFEVNVLAVVERLRLAY